MAGKMIIGGTYPARMAGVIIVGRPSSTALESASFSREWEGRLPAPKPDPKLVELVARKTAAFGDREAWAAILVAAVGYGVRNEINVRFEMPFGWRAKRQRPKGGWPAQPERTLPGKRVWPRCVVELSGKSGGLSRRPLRRLMRPMCLTLSRLSKEQEHPEWASLFVVIREGRVDRPVTVKRSLRAFAG